MSSQKAFLDSSKAILERNKALIESNQEMIKTIESQGEEIKAMRAILQENSRPSSYSEAIKENGTGTGS
jgi:hypothetical protein